jgi:asparagine synthetase B (glutamine-hydrolysing)
MCGICGIFGIEDNSLIEKMLLVLKHRGPDGKGIYTNTNFSMGHSRLSIIDLSQRGRQPMSNETGDIYGNKVRVCEPIRFLLKNLTPEMCKYDYFHP